MSRELDFIYIGTPKAGSTWLFEALRAHPEARLFPSKASKFFETEKPGSITGYRRQLDRFEEGGKIGEISHDAYLYPHNAKLLREQFPDVKIIACLREPGDFAKSMLLWLQTHTHMFGDDAASMTSHPHLRRAMDFVGQLRPFYDLFPADQIRIVFFEDLKSDPRGFYNDICAHIGISPAFEPEVLQQVVNPARAPRFPAVTHAIFDAGVLVRKAGFGDLVEAAKRFGPLEKLLYKPRAEIDPAVLESAEAEREKARAIFDPLEQLIGRKLPSRWREA